MRSDFPIKCISTNKPYKQKEDGKAFELSASQDIHCEMVAIDGCVFKNAPFRKCDWLFLLDKNQEKNKHLQKSKAYFVELKGNSHSIACEQLLTTIEKTREGTAAYDCKAIVVTNIGWQPNLITGNKYFKQVKKLIGKDIVFEKVHKGNSFTHIEKI